jgi:hypothetical protein
MALRACLCTVVAVLLPVSAGEAKVLPQFGDRSATPGERVRVDLGVDPERYLAAARVYLVPIDEAGTTKGQTDPHLRMVVELGARPVPRTFEFTVPQLPPGLYVGEMWFRGIRTDWYEMAGRGPRLTIREASSSDVFGLADVLAALKAALPW